MNTLADRRTVGEIVTRLYTAAGRKVAGTETTDPRTGEKRYIPPPEFAVFAEVLAGVDAELATEASRRMVAAEDWRWRPPSPALLLSYVRDVRDEWRQRQAAIPPATGPVMAPEVQRRLLAELRAKHPRGGEPAPVAASLPRIPATAHDLGDHQFCQPDCGDQPPIEETA